jgi:transposase
MVYIGVDLHRKRSQLAAIDSAGQLLFNRSIPSESDAFLRVFGELAPEPIEVAFEATIGWGWFADLLADVGVAAHMAHPLATRAIATARVKNDAVDAKTLAHLLRTHLLPEAWIAPLEVREARRLVRMRAGLVRMRSRLKCQIHALLAEAGVSVSMTDLFGRGGRDLLAGLKLPAISQGRLEANLRLIDTLGGEIDAAEREIARRSRTSFSTEGSTRMMSTTHTGVDWKT